MQKRYCHEIAVFTSVVAQWSRISLQMQEPQETRFLSLDWEDALVEEMAAHSSILARKIPWTEEPGVLHSMGSQRVGRD